MLARTYRCKLKSGVDADTLRASYHAQVRVISHAPGALDQVLFLGEPKRRECLIVQLYEPDSGELVPSGELIWALLRDHFHAEPKAEDFKVCAGAQAEDGVFVDSFKQPEPRGSRILEVLEDFRPGGPDPFDMEGRHEAIAEAIRDGEPGFAQGYLKRYNSIVAITPDGPLIYGLDPGFSRSKARATILDGTAVDPPCFWASPGFFEKKSYESRLKALAEWFRPTYFRDKQEVIRKIREKLDNWPKDAA